ncbi:MAG: hypothetical protein ACI3ZQ_10500 [Candidatus Cryptobacteroides sp.]
MKPNMRAFSGISFLCMVVIASFPQFAGAQEKKTVSGYITNRSDGDKPLSDVVIFAYNTVAEAQDAYYSLIEARKNKSWFSAGLVVEAYPDSGGYYEVLVPETGALLFYTGIADPVLEKVNYRLEINVAFSLNIILESSKVTAGSDEKIQRMPPVQRGPNTVFPVMYNFPARDFGKTDARLVKQSYLVHEEGDSMRTHCLPPIVHDGRQYHGTQLRRMNYEGKNDPLYMIAGRNVPLSDTLRHIAWVDTIPAAFSKGKNYLKWKLWVEDYRMVVFADSGQFRTDRISRPMQFLEFPVKSHYLDPEKFRKNPRRERRDMASKLSLKFLIGQAKLDPSDTAGLNSLERLKNDIAGVLADPDATLKEFHIVGVASPDGNYERNVKLAGRRLDFALDQIRSVLPKNIRDRVYMTTKASVASWESVAALLERDAMQKEADDIRRIIAKYPGNFNSQMYNIKRLPYYGDVIVPRLPELRSISYSYVTEIYRELSRNEIYEMYVNDRNNGIENEYALYEYWNLFNIVEDENELERLYIQAYKVSEKTEAKPWVLPANRLAAMSIEKGQVDTAMISPFIDTRFPCNYIIRDMNRRTEEMVNPEEVIANMVTMCLMDKDYVRANDLATMLPEKYRDLKAAAWCLSGHYDDTSEKGREYFVAMRNFSPRNKVVMNLANGNMVLARAALNELPQDDPVTRYLSVQIMCNGMSSASSSMDLETYDKVLADLLYCFKADSEFIDIAERDYTICEDLYKDAKRQYDNSLQNN